MSFIFGGGGSSGGGGGSTTSTGTQTNIAREAPEVEARKLSLYDQAAKLATAPVNLPGLQVAPLSPLEQAGITQSGTTGVGGSTVGSGITSLQNSLKGPDINQFLNIKQSYKLLPNIESRALIYQGILINTNPQIKLELAKILKKSFNDENIGNAFKDELKKILDNIDISEVPSDYTMFYEEYTNQLKENLTKIKINNKILHQSKLLNYFIRDESIKIIEKDLNDLLKKTKKNKKYIYSIKDIILIETLKSDGVKMSKKYKNIYKINENNMPEDIRLYIDNNEIGLVLLRLVEIIGQDDLTDIDSESLYFIISALNQLNINVLRNKILLKILPLKV